MCKDPAGRGAPRVPHPSPTLVLQLGLPRANRLILTVGELSVESFSEIIVVLSAWVCRVRQNDARRPEQAQEEAQTACLRDFCQWSRYHLCCLRILADPALQTLQTPRPFQPRCSAGASQLVPIADDCRHSFGLACADSQRTKCVSPFVTKAEIRSYVARVKKVPCRPTRGT